MISDYDVNKSQLPRFTGRKIEGTSVNAVQPWLVERIENKRPVRRLANFEVRSALAGCRNQLSLYQALTY